MEKQIIFCFCTEDTKSGNPAAIISDFNGDRDVKQKLAKELAMPVTVFLSNKDMEPYQIEFYYPDTEMPLCLHGTLGAAYVLFRKQPLNHLMLMTKSNHKLEVRRDKEIIQVCVSSSSTPHIKIDNNFIQQMLNLKSIEVFDVDYPLVVASVGSPKLLIPLKTFEQLATLAPDFDLIAKWSKESGVNGMYVYTPDSKIENVDFYARGFNPKAGHHEDAATGVAAAALSLSLKRSFVIGQGIFMQRPSAITVSYENDDSIWVGGKVREEH